MRKLRLTLTVTTILAVVTMTVAQEGALVIARDGSLPRSDLEKAALKTPIEANIKKLEAAGYIRVPIDSWATLLVDPYAPPLRDLHVENVLLLELPLDGKPFRYGSLSGDAKEALNRRSGRPFDNGKMTDDTLISVATQAALWFGQPGGRQKALFRPINVPSAAQQQEMGKRPTKPLTDDERKSESSRTTETRAELAFDNVNRKFRPGFQQLYRRCTEEINKLVEAEVEKRDKRMLAALQRLAQQGTIPDSSWTRASIPEEMMQGLSGQVESGWSVLGFDSREDARNWLASAPLVSAYVTFSLCYSDDFTNEGYPMINMMEFAQGGR